MKKKLKKGITNPRAVKNYILDRLPYRRRRAAGRVTFNEGQFVADAKSRFEFSAEQNRETLTLLNMYQEFVPETAKKGLEIGCGYARLTPWLNNFTQETYAIDINISAVQTAQKSYPSLNFVGAAADSIPFNNNVFDVVFTWTVLQHIPPDLIKKSTEEIDRILSESGKVIICEKTEGKTGPHVWVRNTDRYDQLLNDLELRHVEDKPCIPEIENSGANEKIMVFERPG